MKIDSDIFDSNYFSVVQILAKLADPTFLFVECGRGSGKTTHILSPRLDRVQNSMPGACLVLASSTYKSILDNILPGLMEYFNDNYLRGYYYEIGTEPPSHFAKCCTFIEDWKHTISFCNGTVVQFVSTDRPESMLGKNAAHLFVDEMLRIPEDKFVERIMPALRSDRAKFGKSPYFMGITGTSSTPNFETDEDWWMKYEQNMNTEIIRCIQEMAYELDMRKVELINARSQMNEAETARLERCIARWEPRLAEVRRGQTCYLRASSLSNLKILGIDYVLNQIKNIKDPDTLNTSIFAIRKNKVKDRFFGKFGKEHIFSDSYRYDRLDTLSIDSAGSGITSADLKHCNPSLPLYFGYDPGPFTSLVVAQRNSLKKEFRVIKDFCVIHPEQHEELAERVCRFFATHRNKTIFLHYDRAANQRDPKWRDYYPIIGDLNDTDAILLRKAFQKRGWNVRLMSLNAPTIYYGQHYRLLNILFGKNDGTRDSILIDENECESLISSIYHSPIKRSEGKILLDKTSEKILDYKDQRLYSTQIATAFMYLLWGEYKKLLPASDNPENMFNGFTGI